MGSEDDLRRALRRIDGRGYKAYRDVAGRTRIGDVTLWVDHVQGDPFAAPSRVRVRLTDEIAGLPETLRDSPIRRVALTDLLARRLRDAIRRRTGPPRGTGGSGVVAVDAGGQAVLERCAVVLGDGFVEGRLAVGLPAAGRRVLGEAAEELLCDTLPRIALDALRGEDLPLAEARRFVDGVENHAFLQAQLAARGLVGFVAEGAILPRESGASDRPLRDAAVPFEVSESLRVEIELPHPPDPQRPGTRRIRGLGIPRGVTLIVGGGYHGKSTLLRALERGVHPHVPGDGRELVACDAAAVKIRAEDGRRVEACDIGAFIGTLPQGRSTHAFCSDDASGSTSQAANIVEAIEVGARVLLLDEDTCATNFMVRDARMQALVQKQNEPITPYLDRVRELHDRWGISSVIVMGGCGDYFDVADTLIEMRSYTARDVTSEAREIAQRMPSRRSAEAERALEPIASRCPRPQSIDPSHGRRRSKIGVRGRETLIFGSETVDLRAVEQLCDPSQTRAIGQALRWLASEVFDGRVLLSDALDRLDEVLDGEGLQALSPYRPADAHPGDLARPRRFEIAAAVNRLRSLRVDQEAPASSSSMR